MEDFLHKTLKKERVTGYESIQAGLPRILLSRSLEQASAFVDVLKNSSVHITGLSLIEIQEHPIFISPSDLKSYQWLFFTSQVAARHFLTKVTPLPSALKIGVIGSASAKVVEKQIQSPPDFISPQANANAMAQSFLSQGQQGPILWPCGNLATLDFKHILKGQSIDPLIIYSTRSCPQISSKMRKTIADGMDFIVFTSPSAVHSFHQHQLALTQASLISIGPSTSEAIRKLFKIEPLESSIQGLGGLAQTIVRQLSNS